MYIKVKKRIEKVVGRDEFCLDKVLHAGDVIEYLDDAVLEGTAVGVVTHVHPHFMTVETPGRKIVTVNWWDITRIGSGGSSEMAVYQQMLLKI